MARLQFNKMCISLRTALKTHTLLFSPLILVTLDQLVKYLVLRLNLVPVVYNSGFAFGLGEGAWPLVLIAFILFLFFFRHESNHFSYWLVVSGGVGNILDRVLYGGRVVDFIHFFGLVSFNLSDVYIVLGILWFGLRVARKTQ